MFFTKQNTKIKKSGGVLLIIKNTIISNTLDTFARSIPNVIDTLTISIQLNNINVILVVNYRSPDSR